MDINNIHDKFVRESFSEAGRAIAFFDKFLPADLRSKLDLSSLVVLQESYLTSELKESFSDLIFQIDIKDGVDGKKLELSMLFEHKSKPDKNLAFQVGHYMFSHWIKRLNNNQDLLPIIPIVYYQGKKKWEIFTLEKLFDKYPKEIKKYLPSQEYIFLALNTMTEEQLSKVSDVLMRIALISQKIRFDPIKLATDFAKIFKIFPAKALEMNFAEIILVYLIQGANIEESELQESLKSLSKPVKNKLMTLYQSIAQNHEKKGIDKGKEEKETEFVLNAFDKGYDLDLINNITSLSVKRIKEILEEHKRM